MDTSRELAPFGFHQLRCHPEICLTQYVHMLTRGFVGVAERIQWLLVFLLAVAMSCVSVCSSKREAPLPDCKRLEVPMQYIEGNKSAFNPAAVYEPQRGWTIIMRHDQCRDCHYWDHKTQALILHLGKTQLASLDTKSVLNSLKATPLQHDLPGHQQNLSTDAFFTEDHRYVTSHSDWHV